MEIIFKYLKGTSDYELFYPSGHSGRQLEIYIDVDYEGHSNNRHSTTGVVSKFANGTISWGSQKQKGTTIAKYVAACEDVKQCIQLSRLFNEISAANNVSVLCNCFETGKEHRIPLDQNILM